MLQDLLGSLIAVLAFAALLYAPGYLLCQAMDLFGFRKLAFSERSTWALACSFCVTPIAAYLVGRSAGLNGLPWLFGMAALGAGLLLAKRGEGPSWASWDPRERRRATLVLCGWIAFVLLMLLEVQVGKKLYFSVAMADGSYRIAIIDAVVRTGLPPANPFYFTGSPAPMPYYYFWYVLCAAVVKLAHVSARQSFIASCIWAGFGLLATVKLYTQHFFRWERRQRWMAYGLLLVSGADLLPALGQAILQPSLNGDTEWWSVDPIDAWPDSLLWVPHHVASVLCCLLGFLFLWRTREPISRRAQSCAILLAAMAFASGFGLSVYVAFGFALLMLAWCARLWLFRPWDRAAFLGHLAIAGALGAVLLIPFALELAAHLVRATDGAGRPVHTFSLSVRRMIDPGLVTSLPVFAVWNRSHPAPLDVAVRCLLLLPGLAMELGLYGAVLVLLLWVNRRRAKGVPEAMGQDEARDTSLFFCVAGLITTMFLSSSVISNNDFGYRAVMLPQFFLLLLTAEVLGAWRVGQPSPVGMATRGKVRLLYSLLALGVVGTVYWAVLLRMWLPIEAHRVQNGFTASPEEAFQSRAVFTALNRIAPQDALIAFRPVDPVVDRVEAEVMTPSEFYQRLLVMNAGRQMLNAEGKCAVHFGGDPGGCSAIQAATAQLYALPAPSAAWARGYCSRFGVQFLVLSYRDPAWHVDTGWPVALRLVAEQPRFRILACT